MSERPTVDQRVLFVQRVEQTSRPSVDGCEGIRLIGVAEELREDRLYGEAVGVEGIQPPLVGGVLQQPETLAVVVDHGVGERGECRIGEQPDHLRKLQGGLVPEDGVEQYQMGHPLGMGDGERNGIGPGRVVTDKHGAGYAELVEHGHQFGPMFLRRESGGIRAIGPTVSEPVEGHGPPRG